MAPGQPGRVDLGSKRRSSTGMCYPWFRDQNMQEMLPSPTGRDLDVHQGGLVWSQAIFLNVSFWQNVFERYLKVFSLLRLVGPCKFSSVPKEDTESQGHTKEHQTWPFPSKPDMSPLLAPQTCRNDHILYPRKGISSVLLSTWKTVPEHVLLMIRNILISVCTHSWPP